MFYKINKQKFSALYVTCKQAAQKALNFSTAGAEIFTAKTVFLALYVAPYLSFIYFLSLSSIPLAQLKARQVLLQGADGLDRLGHHLS